MVIGIQNQHAFLFFEYKGTYFISLHVKKEPNKCNVLVCIWFYFLEPVPVP